MNVNWVFNGVAKSLVVIDDECAEGIIKNCGMLYALNNIGCFHQI